MVPRGSAHPGRGHPQDAGTRPWGRGSWVAAAREVRGHRGCSGTRRDSGSKDSGAGGCSSLGMLVPGVGARRDATTKGMGTGSRDTGCQGCSSWDMQYSGSRNAGTQGFREWGVLAPGILSPCAAALGLQGLLVSKNKFIWHAGDRSSQRGTAQDAGSQGMPQRGRDGVLRCRDGGRLFLGWSVPLQLLSATRETVVSLPLAFFPSQPISCSPKPMLSVPGAPGAPVLQPSLLHFSGAG